MVLSRLVGHFALAGGFAGDRLRLSAAGIRLGSGIGTELPPPSARSASSVTGQRRAATWKRFELVCAYQRGHRFAADEGANG